MALSLPFLVLGRRQGRTQEHLQLPTLAGYAVAFSTIKKANAFMASQGTANSEFTLISRPGLQQFIDDLQKQGLTGVCFNAEPDGSCGTIVERDQLINELS
jgi:hypothetical protein